MGAQPGWFPVKSVYENGYFFAQIESDLCKVKIGKVNQARGGFFEKKTRWLTKKIG